MCLLVSSSPIRLVSDVYCVVLPRLLGYWSRLPLRLTCGTIDRAGPCVVDIRKACNYCVQGLATTGGNGAAGMVTKSGNGATGSDHTNLLTMGIVAGLAHSLVGRSTGDSISIIRTTARGRHYLYSITVRA